MVPMPTPTKRKAVDAPTTSTTAKKTKPVSAVITVVGGDPDTKEKETEGGEPETVAVKHPMMDSAGKFYELEDRLAASAGHEKLHEQFFKETSSIKEAMREYSRGQPLQNDLLQRAARIRRIGRLVQYATSQLRKETAARLEQVDAKVLQLQNVTSEVQHIQKEISRCLEFSAGDEDLDLVPVEEFYESAPTTISNPEMTKSNEHEQYLARLNYEVMQRKQMQGTLQELEVRRNVLLSDINGKEQRLQSLRPKIDTLIEAALPVQELLGMKNVDVAGAEQSSLCSSLPSPLTVIHIHATAYKDIMEDKDVQVKVVGMTDDANKYNKTQKDKDDVEAFTEHVGEETVESRVAAMASRLFDVHPTRVDVCVLVPDADVSVTMQLRYLTELKVTALDWLVEDTRGSERKKISSRFMANLFDGDNGESCPEPIGQLKMQQLKMSFESAPEGIGRPYRFVQMLSGGNAAGGATTLLTDQMRRAVTAIRERVVNYFALSHVLGEFEKKKAGALGGESNDAAAPVAHFAVFERVDEEEFASSIPGSLSGAIVAKGFTEYERFRVELEDKPSASRLSAWIAVPVDYPRRVPLFGIAFLHESNVYLADDKQEIQQLEDLLNSIPNNDPKLFVHQMRTLCDQYDLLTADY